MAKKMREGVLYKMKKLANQKPEIRDKIKEFVEKNPDQVL